MAFRDGSVGSWTEQVVVVVVMVVVVVVVVCTKWLGM
jgi:hypothetical protein